MIEPLALGTWMVLCEGYLASMAFQDVEVRKAEIDLRSSAWFIGLRASLGNSAAATYGNEDKMVQESVESDIGWKFSGPCVF